ncbi:MAG: hypothetical protein JSW11_11375 [Candidatus Heimdallarchaeota archaeon]|nr:MAG: hypothetical protein JSW11_11375 [Candidatus Heimdallarchaeota archaeon]
MIMFTIKRQKKSMFLILGMFLLIISGFFIFQTSGAYEIGEDLDQTQGDENYGYWFDDTVIRWQEFRPMYSTLTRLDLNVDKIGNPGNMLVNITDGQQSLWNTTVLEANIMSGATWVNITLESALPLIPERLYYIYVRSDTDSTSTSDRYTWDGHLNSNYTRGVSSITTQPNFDFTFVTWSLSNDREIYLDQTQNGVNYGFWFEAEVIRWQEFKPLYSTLTRLDLYINKYGNPGNMQIKISDGHRTLWNTTILEADINTFGWINISVDPALPLVPEQSYFISVGSDAPSPDVDNQYVWRGFIKSNYYRGMPSVGDGWPTYDFAFRTWSTPSDTATYLDQVQEAVNYGFAFTDSWNAWQEFVPLFAPLTQLDLNIQRMGDPGNVLVNITDGQTTVWNTTVSQAEIPAPGGWVSISFLSALPLIPGNSYYIYIRSVDPMVSGTHYYAWSGHIVSNYTRGDTNVQSGWPTYDYAFRTWIRSSDLSGFTDQIQDSIDEGYFFSNSWNAWQEFKPYYSTLTQLDLYFKRIGDPGNVLVNITDDQSTLWITTIFEADMPVTEGWVSISFPAPLSLIPENSYYIYVRSEDPYIPLTQYYLWMGHPISNYTRGITNKQASNPTFDYAFKTTGLFCDRSAYLDQVQDSTGLSVMLDEDLIRWQEFIPVYDTLTRLDLYITRDGDPGNVLINISQGQNILWQTMILPTDITILGWVNISIPGSLHLIAGQSYNISICTDTPSTGPANRYYWRGIPGVSSNYYRGISSLEESDPGFDFSFRVWGQYDVNPPKITITNPTNQGYSSSSIWLNFTVNEPTSWIGYSLDGAANVTITENKLLDSLSEGTHNVTIYTNDLAGNSGSFTVDWFTIDTLNPNIDLAGPMNVTYTTDEVWIDFTIDEPASWIGYSLDGATNITITGNTLLGSLSEGSHYLVIYTSDLVGNTGETSVWFTVEIPEPEPTTTIPVEPDGTTAPTTTEPEPSTSTTSIERPSVSTPGFTALIAGFAILSVLVFLRRRH